MFDYVVVANGHFTKPKIPILSGEENFNGQIIHSHDFKTAERYTGIGLTQMVLLSTRIPRALIFNVLKKDKE